MNVVSSSNCLPPFAHSSNGEADQEFIPGIEMKPVTIQYAVSHEVCTCILVYDGSILYCPTENKYHQ